MSTLDDLKLKTVIYDAGRLVNPATVPLDLSDHTMAAPRRIAVAGGATNVTIPITTRGTIRTLLLWTDKATTTLTVKINSSAARKVCPVLRYDSAVATLTVTNSDADNAKTLYVGVITS